MVLLLRARNRVRVPSVWVTKSLVPKLEPVYQMFQNYMTIKMYRLGVTKDR